MPPAARITDMHVCSKTSPVPHIGGPIITGCATVIIGGQPAARVGDAAHCVPIPDKIVKGEPSVLIGFAAAARQGDPTDGGNVTAGCPTVRIGSNHGETCMEDAAADGASFVSMGDG